MYELVEKGIDKIFDKKAFLFQKYSINGEVKNNNDIRKAIPLFFSKSVLSYLKLVKMIEECHDIINDSQNLEEFCNNITEGHYLSMDYFFSKISDKGPIIDDSNNTARFANMMFDCLEYALFAKCEDDFDETERMIYLSLFVYYDLVKSWIQSQKMNRKKVINDIMSSGFNNPKLIFDLFDTARDLFTFHDGLLKHQYSLVSANHEEGVLRCVLYNCIKDEANGYFLHILRELYQQITMLRTDEEKCERIARISFNYGND